MAYNNKWNDYPKQDYGDMNILEQELLANGSAPAEKPMKKETVQENTEINHREVSEERVEKEMDNIQKSLVINAFGGPGAGKTTSCHEIVAELKKRG